MPKKIPYAVASYEEIVEGGYHFVDKTRFIRTLEDYKIPVMLRPRRFGKSLWCSILECYYDVNRKDKFEALFANTDIGRHPTSRRNQHLVMRFDFSRLKVTAKLQEIENEFDQECANAYRVFLARYGTRLPALVGMNFPQAASGLARILTEVGTTGQPPVYIIIDEYDNFTNQLLTTRQDALYDEVTTGDSFLRAFYKVIKAGVGERTVDRVFITGVLPVTMDDLTSGFNIGQIVTLKPHLLAMLGFTQAEVDTYVDEIFREHGWSADLRAQVATDLRAHYNGYRLLPDATETLYNSTILNYYLSDLVLSGGKIPELKIDENIRVDVNWLRRLTGSEGETRKLLEKLMFAGELPLSMPMLSEKFNRSRFFEEKFYPLSLYYLGMTTFRDRFTMEFPNLTVKTIFTEYFNEVEHISVTNGYTEMFRRFVKDGDWGALFGGYWERYLGQIPAQAFDKINENFIRTTFYHLCTQYLTHCYLFAIEVNHPSGRSDWEAVGRPNTEYANFAHVIEFKHYSAAEGAKKKILGKRKAAAAEIAQVDGYAKDLAAQFPWLTSVRRYVCYTVGNQGFKFLPL